MEIKSKAQFKLLLQELTHRGKFPMNKINKTVALADLPERVNGRKGEVRARIGGYRALSRHGTMRKGETR